MTVRFGTDISSHQGNLDLAQVRNAGLAFVYAKATQGTSYTNPYYARWAASHDGLIFIPYHFVTMDAPAAQAAYFKSVAGRVPAVMLDFETGGPTAAAGIKSVIDAFRALGYAIDVYLPRWFWQKAGSPSMTGWGIRNLIASDYPSSKTGTVASLYPGDTYKGWDAYGGVTPSILQYSETATVAGQTVDADAASTRAVFTAPTTTPAPPKPPATTIVSEEEPMQIEPLSVHPGGYVFDVPDGKTQIRLTADGDKNPGAQVRIAYWNHDSPTVPLDKPPYQQVGGSSGHHTVGIKLPSGCTGVSVTRMDSQNYPVALGFHA